MNRRARGYSCKKMTRIGLRIGLRVAVSAGLLAVILWTLDLEQTAQTLAGANLLLVAATIALLVVQVVCNAYKLMVLVRCRVAAIRLRQMIRTVFISLFVGEFFPGTVGTELTRMHGVARDTADPALSFSAVVMDRIVGLAGLVCVVLAGLLIDPRHLLPDARYWALGALAAIVLGWLAAMSPAFRAMLDRLMQPKMLAALRDKVHKVYACMDAFRRRPGVLLWAFILAVAYNALRALTVFTAARAVGITAPLTAFLVVVPLVILAVQLPVTIGGFGLREASYIYLLHIYAVPGAATLALSFLLVITGTLGELIPGAVLFVVVGPRRTATAPAQTATTPIETSRPATTHTETTLT